MSDKLNFPFKIGCIQTKAADCAKEVDTTFALDNHGPTSQYCSQSAINLTRTQSTTQIVVTHWSHDNRQVRSPLLHKGHKAWWWFAVAFCCQMIISSSVMQTGASKDSFGFRQKCAAPAAL